VDVEAMFYISLALRLSLKSLKSLIIEPVPYTAPATPAILPSVLIPAFAAVFPAACAAFAAASDV
jgi:hypothetical protein